MSKINYPKKRYTGPKPWINKDWLYNEYVTKDRSTQEIADEYGCKQNTIQVWLLNHGIKKEIKTHNIKRNNTYHTYEFLYNEHIVNRKSLTQIANECGVDLDTIRHHCQRLGIKTWRTKNPVNITPYINDIIFRYVKKKDSIRILAIRYGSSEATIKKVLMDNNIPIRTGAESQFNRHEKVIDPRLLNPEWMSVVYNDANMTLSDIARVVKVDPGTVKRYLIKYGIIPEDVKSDKPINRVGVLSEQESYNALIKLARAYTQKYLSPKILKRDKFTCQICGSDTHLDIHHQIPLSTIIDAILKEHPDLDIRNHDDLLKAHNIIIKDERFLDENNLITCCMNCHVYRLHGNN